MIKGPYYVILFKSALNPFVGVGGTHSNSIWISSLWFSFVSPLLWIFVWTHKMITMN